MKITKKHTVTVWVALAGILAVKCAYAQDQLRDPVFYEVVVELDWSPETHPVDYPASAHWSRMYVVTHNGRYTLFGDGDTATTGLALLATNGRFNILQAEFDEAKRRRRVAAQKVVSPPTGGSGKFSFEIEATTEHPMLSLATMIAPSPDWFAGAADIELYDANTWVEQLTFPIFVWDAGADSGASYKSADEVTQPRESIRLLAHPAFLQTDGLKPIGKVKMLRKE